MVVRPLIRAASCVMQRAADPPSSTRVAFFTLWLMMRAGGAFFFVWAYGDECSGCVAIAGFEAYVVGMLLCPPLKIWGRPSTQQASHTNQHELRKVNPFNAGWFRHHETLHAQASKTHDLPFAQHSTARNDRLLDGGERVEAVSMLVTEGQTLWGVLLSARFRLRGGFMLAASRNPARRSGKRTVVIHSHPWGRFRVLPV